MAAQNPYRSVVDGLVGEIDTLRNEIAASSGAEKVQMEKELAAKENVLRKLMRHSSKWKLTQLEPLISELEALASSALARQAHVVARLRRLVTALGGDLAEIGDGEEDIDDKATEAARTSEPHVQINLTERDLDALERVAASEVGHFGTYGQDQLEGGVASVVETIINRVAHKDYPSSVSGVVNQPAQFSAIDPDKGWPGLSTADVEISKIVKAYVDDRVDGTPGRLRGATHFLNPYWAAQSALKRWGNHVVANAVASFGDDDKKDIHYHGFAPGTKLPSPYAIYLSKWSPIFDGRGKPVSEAAGDTLRARILQTLLAERDYFENGKNKESDDPHYKRVGDYWQALGESFDGRSLIELNGKMTNPYWSAAFVSWVIISQGIGPDRFRGNQGHCRYVEDIFESKLDMPLFEALDPDEAVPEPGDLVHYGRGNDQTLTLTTAKTKLAADKFYSSHSDFVAHVDRAAGKLTAIGGNVANSVKQKRIAIDSYGRLLPHDQGGRSLPWITVLKLRA